MSSPRLDPPVLWSMSSPRPDPPVLWVPVLTQARSSCPVGPCPHPGQEGQVLLSCGSLSWVRPKLWPRSPLVYGQTSLALLHLLLQCCGPVQLSKHHVGKAACFTAVQQYLVCLQYRVLLSDVLVYVCLQHCSNTVQYAVLENCSTGALQHCSMQHCSTSALQFAAPQHRSTLCPRV